jgi:hypothetical protein
MGKWKYSSTPPSLITWALDGGEWSASRSFRYTPGETALGANWIGGWVDLRASLDGVEKEKTCCPCRESIPRPASSLVAIPKGDRGSTIIHKLS